MSYPVFLSFVHSFHSTSILIYPFEHFLIAYFVSPAYSFHLSPQPHLECFCLSTSIFLSVHVSHPYRATGHTDVLILFFNGFFICFVNNSLLNACLSST